jgi:glycosyltransferase involved in cell wall biosynthesis
MSKDPLLSVIIPVFNERHTLGKLLDRVRAVPLRKEIILVDDASTDGTRDTIAAIQKSWPADPGNQLHVFLQPENAGKGAAVRRGIEHVKGDIALIQDADLEYNPAEYPQLIEPILNGDADVVYGSRFLGGPRRVLFFRHTMGNRLLTFLSNLFTDLNLTDMETCYKVFRTEILKRIHLKSNRFGMEPEITAKVAKMGCRIYEIPISYHGREYWEGKKIGWKDGFAAIWTILKYSFTDDDDNADAGYVTLRRLRNAKRYNDWVWSLLDPHVGDRVLEVGCGVGNFTHYLRQRDYVLATDNNEEYLAMLRSSVEHLDHIEVENIDWEHADFEALRAHEFDTILCLNVLEHIENDRGALAAFASILPPGGRLVLQVPAMQSIYGEIDRAIGHYRRYEAAPLRQLLEEAGFEVQSLRFFNIPGILGWYVNAVLLGRSAVPGIQARLVNLLVPLLRLEQRFSPSFGMALIAVGRKKSATASDEASFVLPDRTIPH